MASPLSDSKVLNTNRQPSEKVIFYRQQSKMQIEITRQNSSWYFKSHYFGGSSRNSGPWRIPKLKKPVPLFSKTLFQGNTEPSAFIYRTVIFWMAQWRLRSWTDFFSKILPGCVVSSRTTYFRVNTILQALIALPAVGRSVLVVKELKCQISVKISNHK